jgi:hypothetical protein
VGYWPAPASRFDALAQSVVLCVVVDRGEGQKMWRVPFFSRATASKKTSRAHLPWLKQATWGGWAWRLSLYRRPVRGQLWWPEWDQQVSVGVLHTVEYTHTAAQLLISACCEASSHHTFTLLHVILTPICRSLVRFA